ncbi:carbohydrate ABC transporter permease [Cohnella massiliensis]|uniref:carbohydrate ABC transporter permease n=1 Tax=Cohnella massiliensis TaxID=1816691 RepID=UPI0009B9A9B2|nr:sugar ABC transporter permease [Cohnella massiliensis]
MKANARKITVWCWIFLAPNLLFYALFQGWPIVASFYYATLDWSGISNERTFVGLANFFELARDAYFWNAFKNSFVFAAGSVPLLLAGSLLLALLLNNTRLKGVLFYRTIFFIPVVTTASIIGIIMVFILGANGPLNGLLLKLHLLNRPVNWLADARWAMLTTIVVYVWKHMGMNMIYWLTALQLVPKELQEAARIDGANRPTVFGYITLPHIAPIGAVIALLDIAAALRAFDLIQTMTGGGPFYKTDVVSTYIYRYAFSSEMGLPRLGYSSAAGIFFGFAIILIALVQHVFAGRLRRAK